MKFVNYVKFHPEKVAALRPIHREYLAHLRAEGKLAISGPFSENRGALLIYEAATMEEAETLLQDDPYTKGGAIASYEILPWQIVGVNLDLLRPE